MKKYFPLLIGLTLLLFVLGCTAQSTPVVTVTSEAIHTPESTATEVPPTPTPRPTAAPVCTSLDDAPDQSGNLYWWNDKVFYEIFVRSFYDSDGDGIGDFNGLIQKLDYLNDGDPSTTSDLGISGIWLMPINASPSYHGYDVTDYYAVNADYGTLDDFKNLLDEAHARGIQVIMDLVLNHTSTEHPWFQDASTNPDSPYQDYYIFSDSPGSFKSPWGSTVWHGSDTGYYYGIFYAGMPDLNYTNPDVVAEMEEVVRFWLEDVGVDGFRLDAIKHIVEEGSNQENTPATHTFWEGFYDHYTGINPDAFTVGEAWTSTDEVVKYIGDEVSIAFEFDTAGAILTSARQEKSDQISRAHATDLASYPAHQYGVFITNHDQDRVMSELLSKVGQAKSAASLLLTGPGIPFLYYGEEIGQIGRKPDENIRSPMQWSGETFAGFTSASMPWKLPRDKYEEFNVAAETNDPESLLSHYRSLIHARNTYPALRTGSMLQLPSDTRGVYAFLRYTEDQTLLVLINLSRNPIEDYRFCLSSGMLETGTAVEILSDIPVAPPLLNADGGFNDYRPIDELAPYSTYIIELK